MNIRICFVGPANSTHMIKWCEWFNNRGYEVHIISFTKGEIPSANVHLINIGVNVDGGDIGKLKYLLTGKLIKRLINEINPDIINVHYATSYGVAMALSGIKNYILSVWGSDIYDFPNRSFLHRVLLKYSIKKASFLFSTSQAMADEAAKYTNRRFEITPFGVDMEKFSPNKKTRNCNDNRFVVGIIKTLSDIYGIDYLIKAISIIKNKKPEIPIELRISGDGAKAEEYKALVKRLNIENIVVFVGRISQEKAAEEWANMDVAVIPSIKYESFGVAAVEAQACGIPVIISDVAGLKEATVPKITSLVVPTKSATDIAHKILMLYDNPEMRKYMGQQGRTYVYNKYELDYCFNNIEKIFIRILSNNKHKNEKEYMNEDMS